MKDIFGEITDSPEVRLFDLVKSAYDFEEALALYKAYRMEDYSESEALELAAADVVPSSWSDFSISQ